MLPKKNRADTKLVDLIFKEGRFVNATYLTFKYIISRGSDDFFVSKKEASCSLKKSSLPRLSFVCPKSVSKLAVKRSLLRRLGYRVLEKYFIQFPVDIAGVFVFKKYQDDISIIEHEIKTILYKIN